MRVQGWRFEVSANKDDNEVRLLLYGPDYQGAVFIVPAGSVRAQVLLEFRDDTGSRNFQDYVHTWLTECLGEEVALDTVERRHRFLEEALELAQSLGTTRDEAVQLVNYVYGRPKGEPRQEVGGVMVTLAALCETLPESMDECGRQELQRCWKNIERIREKHAAKPRLSASPLPGLILGDDGVSKT